MPDHRLLVVEDDEPIARPLCDTLRSHGYDVRHAATGMEAIRAAHERPVDLVVLDLGLPDVDGLEVCRRIRADVPNVAILVLTARREELDVVLGLDAGADDYLVKPFRLQELLARVRARLRRNAAASEVLRAGTLEVDLATHRVVVDGRPVELRPKEFDLLVVLAREPGRVLRRDDIMRTVWDRHWESSTKTLDIHVHALRRKLDPPGGPSCITTVRGVGYRLEAG